MKREFSRPRVLVSRCIEFDHCRWNGLIIASDVVKLLKPHVEFVPVCPEMEVGLGVPRDPVRLMEVEGQLQLYQPASEKFWTREMQECSQAILSGIGHLDGAILKGRSPTCGIKDVTVHPNTERGVPEKRGVGLFAAEVRRRFPSLAIEEEGRLTNYSIREHFLTRLFTVAAVRQVRVAGAMGGLVRFHTEHKMLLMAHDQNTMRAMGALVANHERRPVTQVLADYEKALAAALTRPAGHTANINVLQHALGFFSEGLSSAEKAFFLDCLEDYRRGRVPLSVPTSIVRAWIVRFDQEYLGAQSFFEPYPEDLVQITDSGKGRDL
jgi:uncharacterized protein YbgA (DUF1722 family)/uncharacterized protein YbbK (DUF523 family)